MSNSPAQAGVTPDLAVTLGTRRPLRLKNPVTTASGTFGYGVEFAPYMDITALGALTTKALTLEAREGNPGRRLVETPAGMLNSIGLMNAGLEHFLRETLPQLRQFGDLPIIVNISGHTVSEYATLAERLNQEPGIAALEVNISCPNVENGLLFASLPESAALVTRAVREVCDLPLFIKLTPNVSDIAPIAKAVEEAGADGISLINSVLGMAIDIQTRQAILQATFGGLSGPAIRPIALRMVYQVYQACSLPIIGMGGITTWEDALEFIFAGASAVAIGTANLVNPRATVEVIQGLGEYCQYHKVACLAELIGAAHR
ncbi:MAG: dihydroorotate dehydrogenase [Symbiobacteriaceae bacterium]|nr:dihydroorotate dehydrogenase [Symbiobacteriaceae bacterium]